MNYILEDIRDIPVDEFKYFTGEDEDEEATSNETLYIFKLLNNRW